jgi:multidrug efflux pump subunit AcrA (membrane-fusion protein)
MEKTEEEKLLLPAGHEPKLLEAPGAHDKKSRFSTRTALILGVLVLILLALLFLFGFLRHRRTEKEAAAAAEKEREAVPIVNVAKVNRSPSNSELTFPGNITPLIQAFLYARASGYVRKRYVDIGDRVQQGQLLAEIEAPDLDEQVSQARAMLDQAQHQLGQTRAALDQAKQQFDLQKLTWDRYKVLVSHGAIARQDADTQYTAYQTADAAVKAGEQNVSAADQNVRANQANLNRLIALQGFEYIRAPFAGVITARNFDVGALVSSNGTTSGGSSTPSGGTQTSSASGNAGTSGSTSLVSSSSSNGTGGGIGELFQEAQTRTLRILVNVPQENAPSIRVGQPAIVLVEQFSKHPFHGTLARTSNSVDLNTRTLLAEVDVDNPNNELFPGMYALVQIQNSTNNPPLLVPGDTIITNANGLQVAILEDLKQQDNAQGEGGRKYPPDAKRIHMQKVEVGRDYGQQIEITRGLQGWEYVVVNPTDDAQEGAVVRPAAAPKQLGESGAQRKSPSEQQPTNQTPALPGGAKSGEQGRGKK